MRQLESILPSLDKLAAEDLTKPYAESIAELPQLRDDLCLALRELVLCREELTSKKSNARNCLENLAENIDEACTAVKQGEEVNILGKYLLGVQARGKIKDSINNIKSLQEKIQLQAADKYALAFSLPAPPPASERDISAPLMVRRRVCTSDLISAMLRFPIWR